MKEILEQIEVGNITAKWNGWNFNGESIIGNWHEFSLYEDGKECGYIKYGDNGLCSELNGRNQFIEQEDLEGTHFEAYAERVFVKALKRDDKELANKLSTNGNKNFPFPSDNCDISREDVLEDKYSMEKKEWSVRIKKPQYLIEFPNYDGDFYLPKGWIDNSWHNDVCPHAEKRSADESIIVYIWQEYEDFYKRESANENRYMFVIEKDSEVIFLYETNSLELIKEMAEGVRDIDVKKETKKGKNEMDMKNEIIKALTDATDEIFLEWQAKLHVISGDIAPDMSLLFDNQIERLTDTIVNILEKQPKLGITNVWLNNRNYDAKELADDHETLLALKKIQEKIEEKESAK